MLLHQSFQGIDACSGVDFPPLRGGCLFLVHYADIETEDIETIRKDLEKSLEYVHTFIIILLEHEFQ